MKKSEAGRRNKRKYRQIGILFLLLSAVTFAEETNVLLRERKEEQTKENEVEFWEREKDIAEAVLKPESKLNIEEKKQEIELGKFQFQEVNFSGNHPLLKKLTSESQKFVHQKMDGEEIIKLIGSLNTLLKEEGYITSRVIFKEGNIYEGKIHLEVISGKIRNIYFKEEGEKNFSDTLKIEMAFPGYKDKILNIRDIDQGIENLNNSGWHHQMEIMEGVEEGYSDIVIYRRKSPGDLSFGYDNSPVDEKYSKLNISYGGGNLFSFNDSISFSYSTKVGPKRSHNKEDSYDLSYSIPYGKYKFSYNLGLTDNHTVTQGFAREIVRDNKTTRQKFRISRVLSRSKEHKTTGTLFLSLRDKESYINKHKIKVQSKKYTTGGITLSHIDQLWGGNIYLSLQYERGLPWFGAEGDHDYTKGMIRKEFNKYSFNADWRKRYFLENENSIEYKMSYGAAYVKDIVLDTYKITIGDEYTVRGFKKTGISGEKGMYINNTLSYRFSPRRHQYLSHIQPFVGLDAGIAKDRTMKNSEYIVGMAYGLKFNADNVYATLTYGVPLKTVKTAKKERNVMYFSVGYSF